MAIDHPFFRCVRPGLNGEYGEGGRWMYLLHREYAPDATHYLRAFTILQSDLVRLFEYVEPADANEATYSYRCLELLIRGCGEVEANCRAILDANGYARSGQLNREDYRRLNRTHRLSSYAVRLPVWVGGNGTRCPFKAWEHGSSLPWFKAHHAGKHNRHQEFPEACLRHVVDSIAGVVVLLAAQYWTYDYGPISRGVSVEDGLGEGFEDAIGGYFQVRFPTDWPAEARYSFNWGDLSNDPSPFRRLTF